MNIASRSMPLIVRSPRVAQSGFVKLGPAVIVIGLLLALGALINFGLSSNRGATSATAVAGAANKDPREVDFGFVELNPGLPTPITSYKNGGIMVLYPGDELRFQVLGDAPLPMIELRVGDGVQTLPGTAGKLQVIGPADKPLPAAMFAQGTRHSMPGGAPPRVSVKVEVYGTARPK